MKIRETQPVSSANFCNLLITSRSREKRYQALPTFPHCKRQKAGRGLGTRLECNHQNILFTKHGNTLFSLIDHCRNPLRTPVSLLTNFVVHFPRGLTWCSLCLREALATCCFLYHVYSLGVARGRGYHVYSLAV